MKQDIRYAERMTDSDALLWTIEDDPLLRTNILVIWILDRAPDRERLQSKIEGATLMIPRLRHRALKTPFSIAPPRWEVDANFDLDYHVRWLRAPGDGSIRALLDMVQATVTQQFDRARPLWELSVIEGLSEDRAALVLKLHHSVSDGVGMVRMTESLVDRERHPKARRQVLPEPSPPREWSASRLLLDALEYDRRRRLGRLRSIGSALGGAALNPFGSTAELSRGASSVARMLRPVREPLSPLLRGRSISVHFDTMHLALDDLRGAAKGAKATVNDAFVAALCGALHRYHAHHGAPVDALRMTMPVDIREGEDAHRAGNQFTPARFAVPLSIADPVERMRTIGKLVQRERAEPALRLTEPVAGVLNRLPSGVTKELFGSMLKGIDFVSTNVRGPKFPVYAAGARMESIFGFGPLSGSAINVALFSYAGQLSVGLSSDRAAVPDPGFLLECMEKGFSEVLTVA
jgi:WS/DGAT/MGAT family acyltransferase